MRHYDIFIIKEEVREAYTGKEALLAQLFSEAFHTTDPNERCQLEKQIDFITETIPVFRMESLLKRRLKEQIGYTSLAGEQVIMLESNHQESHSRLEIKERQLTLKSSGSLLTETLLFEVCRSIQPDFFAVDRTGERSGWLRATKKHLIKKVK
ncbi:sporulation inhibitor of replication protein SirA [Pullulanibacillus sp. KACC 23026]|uniref:sporulation inhibitor of replication protein SirA n=1 Tax=Pullulanibacillus sp. KACC 23026 TaxID=3028315 RepID=UPI0023B1A691|nr:sporulation inhibitor of replication protein SirA [Pullulanibacillus sp. KACC 23026]WEG11530.1 sporulation inhibitor of replication protein SirA [Pullulanibacillus sp. KACC 23026]